MQKAYNPQTNEYLFLVNDQWVKPEQSAVNPKTGEKAFLVNNQWEVVAPTAPATPAEPAVTDEELAAASSPVTLNPRLARQGAQGRAAARPNQSVMAELPPPLSFEQPTPAPIPSVVRLPDPVQAVEAQLNAMPAAQRQAAINRFRNDPKYGAAVQEVERRYSELAKAPETLRRVADQTVEARAARLVAQGLRPEYAEQQAQIDALRGQPSNLQQATRDIIGEQAGQAAEQKAEELKDAGFWERVGAGTASSIRKGGMGVLLAAADSGIFGNKDQASKNLLNAIRVEEATGKAVPEGESIFEKSAQGAMTSLAGQAPTMILGMLTGSAAPILAQAAIQTFGQEYADGRASGLAGREASARAVPMAAAEVFFERFGMTKALAGLRAHVAANGLDSVPAYVAKSIATEIPSELATTATQYGIDILPTIGLKKPSLVGLYNELEETLRQTILQAGATAGVTTGVVKATRAAQDIAAGRRQPYKRDTSYDGLAQRMIEQAGFVPSQRPAPAAPQTVTAAEAPEVTAPPEGIYPRISDFSMGNLRHTGDEENIEKIRALERQLQQAPGMVAEEQVAMPPAQPETPQPAVEPPTSVEQPAPPHTVAGLPIVEAPVNQLKLSEDVPQFKAEANIKGVVEPLGGKFERTGVAPIQLWRRTNGDLEVISGRHRLDLARRSGEETIPAQIHDEATGFDKQRAATLDAELNIRDGQGKVKDYVSYFKGANISKEEADARGLLARAIGKRSFAIANEGSEELVAAHRADVVGDEAAYLIAQNAPNDSRLQAVGIKAVQDGKSASNAVNMMQAVRALAGERDTTTDMFGFDDSAMREAEEMAKIAARKQREIAQRLSVMTGASKNPTLAKAEGIDIRDPEAVKKRVEELRQAKSSWDSWSTNPNLVAEIRAERGVAAPELTLRGETEEEIRAREEAASEEQRKAEEKAIADREVDLFGLQPQTQEREEPPTEDMFGGEPSAEYQIAREKSNQATRDFAKVQQAYRNQEIGDEEFLAARKRFDKAQAEFDEAYEKEAGRGETPATRQFAPPLEGAKEIISEGPAKGATDQEVADIADVFAEYEGHSLDADGGQITHVFDAPAKSEIVRTEDKSKIYHKEFGWMTLAQAKEQIEKWKEHAAAQGKTGENSDKIVLSLFDLTGQWSQPWEDAGYQVFRFDIQNDPEVGDVNKFSTEFFNDYFGSFEGQDVYAILAACPCTDFAVSGARHFAAKDADGRTRQSIELVQQTLATVEYFKPSVWAIENPVGRIEKLTGLPPWRLSFNPNHFGDPYTKRTLLWGRFNADLPISPVEPTEGSKMHTMYGGKSQETKNARSVTPEGFAYSFFMANNAVDNPILAVANKYDRLDRHVIEDALAAGVSPKEIDEAVEDHYYMDLDDKAAERAIRQLVAEKKKDDVAESKFIETKVKGDLEKIAKGYLIGDIVRLGNTPGVVVGVEGDYVRFRPDTAKSPKAYQRVQAKQLTMVARPDQVPDSAASKTPDQEKKFGTEDGHLNADMGGLIQLLGANMYASNLADVAVKELLQNAFDAVKGAVSNLKGQSLYKAGQIDIKMDSIKRTISITDNARGMTPEIVRDAFFTVAGSNKSDLAPEERSGGLGLAKMGFMLGADRLQLDTVRDGVRVTVDTTSKDIANSKFQIKKSPAPKDAHGTTVTVTIPEEYIDPKTGDKKSIWFPWSADSITPLNHPLIGPVTVNLNYNDKKTTLAVGNNFPVDKYQQFKVNFDWGSADIYFGVERREHPMHQVLSSGVYQFNERFALSQSEIIPYDIIVNVKPSVEAKHPDYPFENSRERFKGRLKNDISALQEYLAQLARGNEMADLQESFKGIVSMPRVEAGQELADTAKKLKKVFDQRGANPEATQLPPLPKEVTVTGQQVIGPSGNILLDMQKKAEKEKEASLKAEKAAPERSQFMIDMKQDPRLPIYHNNTNVDFLEIGRKYGEPEKFFAELGTLMVEMKEAVAKSGLWGYDVLTPENLFFAGVSVDKKYGGVHIKVPYKAVLLNPFYDWGAKSLFGVRQNFLNTMIHEIAHTGSMDHGVAHNSQMIKVEQYLADEGLLDYFRDALLDILSRHESAFTAMREAYGKSTTQNTAKSLEDYGKQPGAASSRGDGSGGADSVPAVQAGARSARSEDIRGGAEEDTEREVSERAGKQLVGIAEPRKKASDFLMNVEPPIDERDLIFGRQAIREEQIKEYAKLRSKLARVPKQVAEGKIDLSAQKAITRLMQQTRDLAQEIKDSAPRRDSAEKFLAKALTEYDNGNISEEVFNVIKLAYDKTPDLLEGLLLSVVQEKPGQKAAGQFAPFERIVTLYKNTRGIYDPVTIRHELTHSLEQMMTPEQRQTLAQAWAESLNRAINQNTDEMHQKYFHAVMNFMESPTTENFRKAQDLLPSYEMYQYINPSEFWAVNAENLMAAELGSAWEKFKRAIRRLWEGLKNVLGFDNRYAVQKTFKDVMNGRRERVTREVLVDFVTSTRGKFTTLENIQDDKNLISKYNRPHTPMLDTSPVKNMLIKTGRLGKDLLKEAVINPKAAVGMAFNKIDAGITYLRNKNTWYGTGLGGADFARYGGSMRTADALATASVALDNAIRSGSIATEVIFRGGIKFNPKAGVFVAVNRAKGMAGVYKAEAKLKARLGDQLATDIIQGYLEAKRSRSIQNEMFEREAQYEGLSDMLKQMRANKQADPKAVAALAIQVDEAKEDLARIKIAFNKIKMSDEEIDDFIAREQAHPELREIMDNWTAINQNMLRFWRQVGLLSQGRYDTLSSIKDYVPWNRIMDDEEDVHSPLQTTTRSMTNIGKEKLFKAGKPTVITDFKAKAGQKVFKIQPASVVSATVNGKQVPSTAIEATPRGDVRLNVPIQEGDLIVFQTSREIENMIDNMTRNVMRMTMNGIRQYAAQRIVNEYATRDEDDKIMVFPSADRNKGRFNFITNGKKVVVEIADPLVAESVFGMETLNLAMLKPLSMASNFVRRTLTLSGSFQVAQLFQDAPTAAWVTGVKNPVKLFGGVYKGFVTSLTNTDPAVDILKAAGIGGFKSLARTPEAEIKQRLGVMNKNAYSFVMQTLDHIGDSSDMAQRVAVYKRVLAETGDEMQALYQAANVLNFNRHGSGALAQAIVKTVAFANAYAQTIEVLFQALAGGGLKGMSRTKALQRVAITGGLLASTTLLYCMLVGGDDEYDKLDDQTKLKNYVIPGTKIAMPMHTSAAYFFKAIPESIYNYVTKRGTDTPVDRKRLVDSLQKAAMDMLLGPTPVPTGTRPIVELALNHDFFTGRSITPARLKDLKAAEQYNATTSEAGKFLSNLTGTEEKRLLNPIEADHLIRGLFGSAGVSVQWASNVLGDAASSRVAMTPKQYPLVGRFMLPTVATGRERLFYDFKEQVDKEYNTMQTQIKREKIQKLQALTPENKKLIGLHDYVSQMDDQLKELNSLIQQIGESESKRFSPEDRREKIDKLMTAKQKILTGIERIREFSQQP